MHYSHLYLVITATAPLSREQTGREKRPPRTKVGAVVCGGGVYSNLCKHMVASLLSSRILIKFQTGLRGMCVCLLMCMHVWRWRDLLYLPSRSGVRACARHHLILPPIQGDRAGWRLRAPRAPLTALGSSQRFVAPPILVLPPVPITHQGHKIKPHPHPPRSDGQRG